jgi:hypothetical protein
VHLLHCRTSRIGKTNREMEKREISLRITSIVTSPKKERGKRL